MSAEGLRLRASVWLNALKKCACWQMTLRLAKGLGHAVNLVIGLESAHSRG
jgi:hypothetical protein